MALWKKAAEQRMETIKAKIPRPIIKEKPATTKSNTHCTHKLIIIMVFWIKNSDLSLSLSERIHDNARAVKGNKKIKITLSHCWPCGLGHVVVIPGSVISNHYTISSPIFISSGTIPLPLPLPHITVGLVGWSIFEA